MFNREPPPCFVAGQSGLGEEEASDVRLCPEPRGAGREGGRLICGTAANGTRWPPEVGVKFRRKVSLGDSLGVRSWQKARSIPGSVVEGQMSRM